MGAASASCCPLTRRLVGSDIRLSSESLSWRPRLHFTPHCLRHTYASLLLQEDGGRLLYVSRQPGHANVTITADTYAKWIRPVGRGVVNALAISSVV